MNDGIERVCRVFPLSSCLFHSHGLLYFSYSFFCFVCFSCVPFSFLTCLFRLLRSIDLFVSFKFSPTHRHTHSNSRASVSIPSLELVFLFYLSYFSHYSSNQALARFAFLFSPRAYYCSYGFNFFSFSFSLISAKHIHLFCRIKTRKKTARKKIKNWSEKITEKKSLKNWNI